MGTLPDFQIPVNIDDATSGLVYLFWKIAAVNIMKSSIENDGVILNGLINARGQKQW